MTPNPYVSISDSLFLYCPMRTLCTASLLILLLGACGLKAPLYLPQAQSPQKSTQPQQSQGEEKKK